MIKKCGIYKITNPKNCIYIGQSIDCERRKSVYKRGQLKGQSRLENSVKKYGWESHTFEIIELCSVEILNDREIFYIKKYKSFNTKKGLNLQSGGNSPLFSDETKLKIKNSQLGKVLSEETKLKISLSHKGKKLSEEHKIKIGKSGIGRVFSEESRLKKSKSLKGLVKTEEQKIKISNSLKGRKRPLEVCLKISFSKKKINKRTI